MTTSELMSDMFVDIENGHVIVKSTDGDSTPKIMAAKFFSRSRLEISNGMSMSKAWPDPDGSENHVQIVFYSNLSKCKEKLKSMTNGPLIRSHPRPCSSSSATENQRENSRSEIRKRSDNAIYEASELTSAINSIKRSLDLCFAKHENLLKTILNKIEEIESSSNEVQKPIIYDQNLSITDMAMQIMHQCRSSSQWRKTVKAANWNDLDDEKQKIVQQLLLSGNKFPSKLSIALGKVLYGDLLKTHLLGEHGLPKRGPRDGERNETISIEKENLLRDILKLFSAELFIEQPGWDILVRGPINQSGRETKRERNRNKRKRFDEGLSEDEENHVNKKKTVPASQPEKLDNSISNSGGEVSDHGQSTELDEVSDRD